MSRRSDVVNSVRAISDLVIPVYPTLPIPPFPTHPPAPIPGRQGALAYQQSTNLIYYCDGTQWLPIGTGAQGFQGAQGGFQGAQGFQGRQGASGFQGFQGYQGGAGSQGSQGAQGASSVGAAEFTRIIQSPNNSVPPGTAFTIDTQVSNSIPSSIVASSGAGGTVFSLNTAGTYVFDYEMSLGSAGSIAVYTGATAGSLVMDNNSIAGSTTATTWIHGRSFVVVPAGPPVIAAISSAVGTSAVVTAGTAAGIFMVRLTILKVI